MKITVLTDLILIASSVLLNVQLINGDENPISNTLQFTNFTSNGSEPFNTFQNFSTTESYLTLSEIKDLLSPPNSSSIMLIDNVKDTRFFQHKLCTKDNSFKTLNLSMEKSFSSLDLQIDLKCAENVKGLEISGPLSSNNLHQILRDFQNVEYLSISKPGICTRFDQDFEAEANSQNFTTAALPKLRLEKLKFLKVSDMPFECLGLYNFLTDGIIAQNLESILFDNVTILMSNLDLWDKFPASFPGVKNLFLEGRFCPNCQLFKGENKWTKIETLNFQVRMDNQEFNNDNFNQLESVKNLLAGVSSDDKLLYFSSNIPIEKNNLLLKFHNLRFLNATLKMNDSATQFSVRFFTKFPKLEESVVKLLFSPKSECKTNRQSRVKVTNLSKYIGPSGIDKFTLQSNCKIVAVKGWNLPCREFSFSNDKSTSTRTVQLFKCPNCSRSGCMR